MLKLNDNSKLQQIVDKYDLNYDADCDYEAGINYACYDDGNIVFDVSDNENVYIYGMDNINLDLLHDLEQECLVEKVEDK